MTTNSVRAPMALLLAWLVPVAAVAQEVQAAPEQAPARVASAHSEPPRGLTRRLIKKKVVVYLHDSRRYQGTLVKLTQDSLVLRVPAQDGREQKEKNRRVHTETVTLNLNEVASVGRPVNPKLLGKKVNVWLHSGRAYSGQLVELSDEYLMLALEDRQEEFALRDVAKVSRVSGEDPKWWEPLAVVGAVVGIGAGVGAVAAASAGEDAGDGAVVGAIIGAIASVEILER